MKKSKFLLLTPLLTIAPVSFVSCGNQTMDAEWIADAIFEPIKKEEKIITNDFIKEIKELSDKEKTSELIYSLYYFANKADTQFGPDKSFAELYEENFVGIKSLITVSSIDITEEKENEIVVKCSFVGYVSFVFLKDYNETYKTNDYVMFTYDFKNLQIKVTESNESCGLKFPNWTCLGFLKGRAWGGQSERLLPIWSGRYSSEYPGNMFIDVTDPSLDTLGIPHNGHHWVKNT